MNIVKNSMRVFLFTLPFNTLTDSRKNDPWLKKTLLQVHGAKKLSWTRLAQTLHPKPIIYSTPDTGPFTKMYLQNVSFTFAGKIATIMSMVTNTKYIFQDFLTPGGAGTLCTSLIASMAPLSKSGQATGCNQSWRGPSAPSSMAPSWCWPRREKCQMAA